MIFAIHKAIPDVIPSIFGFWDETIKMSPRYFVRQVRVSIVFRPHAINDAQGCFTDIALIISPLQKWG